MKYLKPLFEHTSDDVIVYLKKESYFDYEEDDNGTLIFTTRENGDMMNEKPGDADRQEAKRLQPLIKSKFGFTSEIEGVDEFIYLIVHTKAPEKETPKSKYWP